MHLDHKQYILFICLIIICGFLLTQVNSDIENQSIDQINSEQMVHVRQAENTLNTFFENYNNSLFFLAKDPHMIDFDPEGIRIMQDYYRTHDHDIASITRVNEKGVILYSYPNESSSGINISNQEHVKQVIKTHEKVISDVFISVQGFQTVAFHAPVFSGSEYKGSVALLIPFHELAKKSLEKIRVLDTGYAFAISKKGVVLYSPDSEQIGRNIHEIYQSSPKMLEFFEVTIPKDEGIGVVFGNLSGSQSDNAKKYHSVFKAIDIGDQKWSIFIVTPETEIFKTLQTFSRDLFIISLIFILTILIFAYFFIQARSVLLEEQKRRVVESALRESEKNYRTIFESIQDVYYRLDKESNLIMMSPSGIRLLGYQSFDEIAGKNVGESFYLHPEDRNQLNEAIESNGSVTNFEITLKAKDGTPIYIQTSSHLYYNEQNEVMGTEGILRDITGEKMTHIALQQALKKLNLLNSVTFNDIQNHAFSLSGYLELHKMMITNPEDLDLISKEEMILGLINHSLEFAKDFQGLGMKPPAWQNVMQSFLFGISHTDISSYHRDISIENLEIFADPLLEKVFFILARNLLVHSQHATEWKMYYQKHDDGLTLFIEDNGVGIPTENKERIFERGYGSQKGMGLFLAREILGITGIQMKETGIPGQGARFEILIPPGTYRFGAASSHARDV